jgi:Leucine-rich repeat (LRR) protein
MRKRLKAIDPLAGVKAAPAKVTGLWLNPAASRNSGHGEYAPLETFPLEIFACKNLVTLELFRAIEDGHIPSALGTLTKLKDLTIGGLTTTALPAEIGNLAKLEVLSLAYLELLTALPASIGKLTRLRDLDAPYTGLTTLPSSVGNLQALRRANFASSGLVAVPRALWKLKALEELYLPDTVTELPSGIGALTKLRSLALSAAALESIAHELPKLRALRELRVHGKAARLSDRLGETKLTQLRATYLGLTALPTTLTRLRDLTELSVAGNQLTTLIDLVTQLPRLATLDFSGNPIAVSERREIERLMTVPPAKRVARRMAAPPPKPKTADLTRLGQVASINASLTLLLADQRVAPAWTGVGDDDDLQDTDWDRANTALAKKDSAVLAVAGHSGVALSLGVGQGVVDVFRTGDRLIGVEAIADHKDDELFLEYVASPPRKARPVATLAVPSKTLVLVPTTEAGDGDQVLAVSTSKTISISLEAYRKGSWGEGRRFFITPA